MVCSPWGHKDLDTTEQPNNNKVLTMFQALIALCIVLVHYHSNPKDNVIGTIGPFYRRGHRGPHRIRESHRGTLLVRVGALSQSHGCLTPKSGFFSLSYAFYLTFHLLLLFHCWKSFVFNKTINSTRARTMLPIPFDNAWHKTGPWLDGQRMFAKYTAAV